MAQQTVTPDAIGPSLIQANFVAAQENFTELYARTANGVAPFGIALTELRKTAAYKDPLGDTPGASLLGLGDTVGLVVTGTQTNGGATATANESASFVFVVPDTYVAGQPISLRVRAKVSAARTVSATVDAVVRRMTDAGVTADLVTTAAQALTTSYANYDFTITPTTIVAGDVLFVDVFLATDDTGGNSNGTPTISALQVRATVAK